jgi:hypothetical protein
VLDLAAPVLVQAATIAPSRALFVASTNNAAQSKAKPLEGSGTVLPSLSQRRQPFWTRG